MHFVLATFVALFVGLLADAVPAVAVNDVPVCAFEPAKSPNESLSALLARHPAFKTIPNITGPKETWWCRVDPNALPLEGYLTVSDNADISTLWKRRADGTYEIERSGTAVPQPDKPIRGPASIFSIEPGLRPAYLRTNGDTPTVSAYATADYAGVVQRRQEHYEAIIFYIGLLVAAGIYHFSTFAFTRSRETFWYGIYIAALIFDEFAFADGFGWIFVWPKSAVPRDVPQVWVVDAIGLALFGFLREFCRTRGRPNVDRLVIVAPIVFIALDVFMRVAGLTDAESVYSYIAFPVLQATAIGIAFDTFRRGDRSALFVVMAFSAYLIGSTTSAVVGWMGTYEALRDVPMVAFGLDYFWEIGAAVEVLMLSLALAERVRQAYRELEEGLVDALTGARNRRFLLKHIEGDVALAARNSGFNLIFMLVDIDHFKAVNDRHGHAAGDQVLAQVSARLASVLRESDYLVRWGGEEFLIVSRGRERSEASVLAERVRLAVASKKFEIDNGEPLIKTCSIGFACYPLVPARPQAATWSQVVEVADRALYLAKNSGRNAWAGVAIASSIQPDAANGPVVDVEGAVARGDAGVASSFTPQPMEEAPV